MWCKPIVECTNREFWGFRYAYGAKVTQLPPDICCDSRDWNHPVRCSLCIYLRSALHQPCWWWHAVMIHGFVRSYHNNISSSTRRLYVSSRVLPSPFWQRPSSTRYDYFLSSRLIHLLHLLYVCLHKRFIHSADFQQQLSHPQAQAKLKLAKEVFHVIVWCASCIFYSLLKKLK